MLFLVPLSLKTTDEIQLLHEALTNASELLSMVTLLERSLF